MSPTLAFALSANWPAYCYAKPVKFLGVIPARGDSKGIPRKNLAPLAGKPLLLYTCEAAKKSALLTRTIISTDNEEIAEAGRKSGVDVPFLRPKELAKDETPILPVLQHILTELQKAGESYDAVVLLQPTSPLRTAMHIDDAVRLFEDSGADTVVSVIEVPHRYNPSSLMKMDGDTLIPYRDGDMVLRRQEKEQLYARNGPAILIVRSRVLLEDETLYGKKCKPYVMDRLSSADIDDEIDLAMTEILLSRRG